MKIRMIKKIIEYLYENHVRGDFSIEEMANDLFMLMEKENELERKND